MQLRSVEDIIGRQAVAALRRPIEEARGLPGAAYTSEEFFKLEQRDMFARTWMCLGFACDIPEPGDAMPMSAAGIPVIAVRGRDREIRVFHNVCRHRAAMVQPEKASGLKQLACPYHAWAWDLEGKLKAMPYFDGTKDAHTCKLDRGELGLLPVRSAVWHHWIFVNLDGMAAPFAEHVRPLEEVMNGADIGATRVAHREDWAWNGNWKCQNDNWETYHHIWVHKNVFKRLADDLDFKTGQPKAEPIPLGTVVTLKRRPGSEFMQTAGDLPNIPYADEAARVRCTSVLFPNMTLTLQTDHLASVVALPVSAGRTISMMGYFFVGDAASAPRHAAGRKRVLDRWLGATRKLEDYEGIRSQDMKVWEQQQIARASPAADRVVFSPVWEKNVHHFQNMLIDVMTRPREARAVAAE